MIKSHRRSISQNNNIKNQSTLLMSDVMGNIALGSVSASVKPSLKISKYNTFK